MNEITLELTNYCPHSCNYCSSNSTNEYEKATFMHYDVVTNAIIDVPEGCDYGGWDIIHLSGGEPLSHPQFYKILEFCKGSSKEVIVHSNAITRLAYNPNVIDGVYLEAYLNVPHETREVHVLKRVEQGREEPKISSSKNWKKDCTCSHRVINTNGFVGKAPCAKLESPGEEK